MRRARALAATLALLLLPPATANAEEQVKLSAAFTPERLGASTTISFAIKISAGGQIPPPLTAINLDYPKDLGFATSGVGLATCHPAQLRAYGPVGCPTNSLMGRGQAFAEFAIGSEPFIEQAKVTLLAGPPQENHLDILVYAEARAPVDAEVLISALLIPEQPPYGGSLQFNVPLVPTVPGAADVSITSLQTTLGPNGITYYETTHRKRIPYHPQGIQLPTSCPHGGFPFNAELTFQNSTRTRAHTTVHCPRMRAADVARTTLPKLG
jgi:hypothetical protein